MEAPLPPLSLQGISEEQLRREFDARYWRDLEPYCGHLKGLPNELSSCSQEYWRQRIVHEFGNRPILNPGYQNNYHNYLAIHVQVLVDEILAINRRLATTNPPSIKRREIEERRRQLYSEVQSASLVLGNVVFETCQVCHSFEFEVSIPTRKDVTKALKTLSGIHPIDSSEQGQVFKQEFIDQRYHLSEGAMLVYTYQPTAAELEKEEDKAVSEWPRYLVFVDQGYYEIAGPYHFWSQEQEHLPKLFIDFLRRKGLISAVAVIHLYSILAKMPIFPEDNWI